jgi:hypothetical protein
MQLFSADATIFSKKKLKKFCLQKVEKTTPISCILMEVVFLCSTECPKQPRTSFPFYKFFHPTISGRISAAKPNMLKLNLN